MNMYQYFKEGDVIKGFCNGFFGREFYNTKVCILVRKEFAVFEHSDGSASVLNMHDGDLTKEMVEEWKNAEEIDS